MVVFVDFEQDGDETLLRHHAADHDHGKLGLHLRSLDSEPRRPQDRVAEAADDEIEDERINPNVNSFSASLSCYPYDSVFMVYTRCERVNTDALAPMAVS